ncbi:hypothetical protein IP76_04810 [Rhizobium sp. AAP43]|nr:hypothetical protein IP76_04810 [Rhizobium sp. AAP43]
MHSNSLGIGRKKLSKSHDFSLRIVTDHSTRFRQIAVYSSFWYTYCEKFWMRSVAVSRHSSKGSEFSDRFGFCCFCG